MLVTESLLKDLIGAVIAVVVIIVSFYKWRHGYWKRKNLPYLEPSIPFGNIKAIFTENANFAILMEKLYKEMKRKNWKHGGMFFLARPVYYVLDPEYVKNIMAKDFQYFVDRGVYYNEKDDPLSATLFFIGGSKWKNLRAKLTPTFTSGKMKMMFSTVIDCEKGLQDRIEEVCAKNEAIDIKKILACFTIDVIGSCAFGLDCDTFKDENSPFRMYGNKLLTASGWELMKRFIAINFPDFAKLLAFTTTPKDVADFFTKIVTDTVNYREKNKITRKDFMQLLIDLRNENLEGDGNTLNLDEIIAQCVVFFVAGYETSSTTMAFALYELSKNLDIQDKLRREINTVLKKYDNKITYEAIQDMKYLDQVIEETLRKYPPLGFLTRECIKDYKLPDEDIIIDKGTLILIPTLGLHYDEDYFPDSEKFDPERFTEENKNSRHRFVYLPFGEGPRMCIGLRFGMMQSKVGLAALLRSYKFTVNQKTQEPFVMKPESLALAVKGEIWLNAEKVFTN